jgi:ribose/xylose/arabinose/galactoside ABC-type transport system permease subunit
MLDLESMKTCWQAILIAVFTEACSLPCFFLPPTRTVPEILFVWFTLLNFPTILLFRSHVWEANDKGVAFPPVVILLIALQTAVWFGVWYGLLVAFQKIRTRWKKSREV